MRYWEYAKGCAIASPGIDPRNKTMKDVGFFNGPPLSYRVGDCNYQDQSWWLPIYRDDPDTVVRHVDRWSGLFSRPGCFEVSVHISNGFRTAEPPPEKPIIVELASALLPVRLASAAPFLGGIAIASEGQRILVFGDSCTFGWRVEGDQTFTHIAEEILRGKGFNVTAYNAGMIGGSPAHAAALLREIGPKIHPDVVVFGLYPGNDLIDCLYWHESTTLKMSHLEFYLRSHSRFINWLLMRIDPPKGYNPGEHRFEYLGSDATWEQSHNEIYNTKRLPCLILDIALDTMRSDFLEMQAICDELGAKLVVVQIPDYFTLDPVDYFACDVADGRTFDQMDPDFWVHWFNRELPEIPFYDPAPVLRKGYPYWIEDIHPDAEGHRKIAEILCDGLVRDGLIRSSRQVAMVLN